METLVPDIREYIFELSGEAACIACCSVSKQWSSYVPAVVDIPKDTNTVITTYTTADIAMMLSSYKTLCRAKPTFAISTYTAFTGGNACVAVFVMVLNGTLKLQDDKLVLDSTVIESMLCGAFRSGRAHMLDLARLLIADNDRFQHIIKRMNWSYTDIVLGGMYELFLTTISSTPNDYNELFIAACKVGTVEQVKHIFALLINAADKYVKPEREEFSSAEFVRMLRQPITKSDDGYLWGDTVVGRCVNNVLEKEQPYVQVSDVIAFTGLPRYVFTQQQRFNNINRFTNLCFACAGSFDISRVLNTGAAEAIKARSLDVLKVVIAFGREYNILPSIETSVIIAQIFANSDMKYIDDVLAILDENPEAFKVLLLMCGADNAEIVGTLVDRALSCPSTNDIFANINDGGSETPLEMALLTTIIHGTQKSAAAVMARMPTPTVAKLNLYLSYACEHGTITSYFVELGASLCVCGNTHAK